jgi:DNA (cytosine-5)-methyltransferase 1
MRDNVADNNEAAPMDTVELFTGCGGLALGLARAGFQARRMSEWDKHSVANIEFNRANGLKPISHWPIHMEDVRTVRWSDYHRVDLVAGGPPCQPFSIGGLHRGQEDKRDMWPEAVRAVREIQPRAFLFENVRGLLRPAFEQYLRWVMLSLSNPEIEIAKDEERITHLERLEKKKSPATYNVRLFRINAADYGAPQKRHRVIIIGLHGDLQQWPDSPAGTHTRERLLWDKWVTGTYWHRHGLKKPRVIPAADGPLVERLVDQSLIPPKSKPWITVRDALYGLGKPGSRPDLANHVLQPGARSYPGHTGSLLDEPAKALKAGVHGVPGGENMIALGNGKVRYLTVREAARLQNLPDKYEFIGSWSENMRQLGNAVPASLAEVFARRLVEILSKSSGKKRAA